VYGIHFIFIKENHSLAKEGPFFNWPNYCLHIATLDFSLGMEEEHGTKFCV